MKSINKKISLFIALFISFIASTQAMDSKTESLKYCLHRITKGFNKTLCDGTTWGAGALAYGITSKDLWDETAHNIRCTTLIGGFIGSLIKNSLPKDTCKNLNSTLFRSIFKTAALDCPFATTFLLSNIFFNPHTIKQDPSLSLFVAGYIGWNWVNNYYLIPKKDKKSLKQEDEYLLTEDYSKD